MLCADQELLKHTEDDHLEKESLVTAHNDMKVTADMYCSLFVLELFCFVCRTENADSSCRTLQLCLWTLSVSCKFHVNLMKLISNAAETSISSRTVISGFDADVMTSLRFDEVRCVITGALTLLQPLNANDCSSAVLTDVWDVQLLMSIALLLLTNMQHFYSDLSGKNC